MGASVKELARTYESTTGSIYGVLRGDTFLAAGGPIRPPRAMSNEDFLTAAGRLLDAASVRQPNGCLDYVSEEAGWRGQNGLSIGGRTYAVPRLAYEVARGPIPVGQEAVHRCTEVVDEGSGRDACICQRCIDPSHLHLIDRTEAVEIAKRRPISPRKGQCDDGHPFDDIQRHGGTTRRRCRACCRGYTAKYNARRRDQRRMQRQEREAREDAMSPTTALLTTDQIARLRDAGVRPSQVNVTEDGHWLWLGTTSAGGYGYSKGRPLHRTVYEAFNGTIPVGLVIDHLCRVRNCQAPDHLEAVPMRINTLRGNHRTAIVQRTGRCASGKHPMSGPDSKVRTQRRPDGRVGRGCMHCYNERRRERYAGRQAWQSLNDWRPPSTSPPAPESE
jgi:hypothetical protein